jgi:uncharacterized membrane protein YqjE
MSTRAGTDDYFRGDATTPTAPPPGTTTTGARPSASGKSAGQLMKEITEDLSSLFRKEIELAKQELGSAAKEKATGAAIIAVAAVFGLLALMFLLLAIRDGFDTFLWEWVADILTALVLLVLGGIAALVARKKLQTPIKADLTKQTVKEDIEWAKSIGRR